MPSPVIIIFLSWVCTFVVQTRRSMLLWPWIVQQNSGRFPCLLCSESWFPVAEVWAFLQEPRGQVLELGSQVPKASHTVPRPTTGSTKAWFSLLPTTDCLSLPASLTLKLQTGNQTAKEKEKMLSKKGKHLPLGSGSEERGVMTKI